MDTEGIDIELVDENEELEVNAQADFLKGDKGEKGETGEKGEKGDPGTTDFNELENKPTKLSDFTNDTGFITKGVSDLTNYYNTAQEDVLLSGKQDKVEGKGLSTNDFTDTYKNNVDSNISARHTHSNKSVLDNISSTDVSNWDNKYDKPNGGIPKTDLSSAVQTSLNKADTAIQEHQDISGKEDKTNKVISISSSSTDTQYPSAKCVYDSQEEQNTDIEKLQEENARLKATLPTTTGEGQTITLNKTAEMEFIKPPLPMGNSEQGILPEQYQQVEYIESTGTQYINTNYTPVENDDINIEKVKNTGTGCLFSAGNSTNQLILLASSSTNYYWKYFAAGNATAFFTEELSNFSTISIINGSISINNVVKASSIYVGTVDTTIQLFRRVNGESYATASIGRFTITNGNKTKLDLIPCYRISDNEVGMYDLVSNTFYTNAGTGTFNKGNNTPNPDYPQEITNVTGDVEVVVSNADSTKSQTFTFPLGNEKLMLGDYLADDGIHHVRRQGVLDGTETWFFSGYSDDTYLCAFSGKFDGYIKYDSRSLLCNTFVKGFYTDVNTKECIENSGYTVNLKILKSRLNEGTLNGLKTWLAERYSNNMPVIVEYSLAQEVIVPYTSAQQEVYNQIKQALSYEEQTNIRGSSNGNNPIFTVEGYQSTKLVLQDFATAIVALGGV